MSEEDDKNNVVSFNTGRELFDSKAAAKRVAMFDKFVAIGYIDGELQIVCTEGFTNNEYLLTLEQAAWYAKLETFGLPLFEEYDDE